MESLKIVPRVTTGQPGLYPDFLTGPTRCTARFNWHGDVKSGVVTAFLTGQNSLIIGLYIIIMVVSAVPALLLNGSSGYATGHPVKYPDKWLGSSVRNIYKLANEFLGSRYRALISHTANLYPALGWGISLIGAQWT